jgi:hypothetical protein
MSAEQATWRVMQMTHRVALVAKVPVLAIENWVSRLFHAFFWTLLHLVRTVNVQYKFRILQEQRTRCVRIVLCHHASSMHAPPCATMVHMLLRAGSLAALASLAVSSTETVHVPFAVMIDALICLSRKARRNLGLC